MAGVRGAFALAAGVARAGADGDRGIVGTAGLALPFEVALLATAPGVAARLLAANRRKSARSYRPS
jgi:hypothetical protein